MGRHDDTLVAVFAVPTRANIAWRAIESMLCHFGAEMTEGRGARVRFELNGMKASFHRPHPANEAGKAMVEDVREFLVRAGVEPG